MLPLATLVNLLAAVIVVGLLVWLIKQIPVDQWIRSALYIVLVLLLLIWLLALFPIVHTDIR